MRKWKISLGMGTEFCKSEKIILKVTALMKIEHKGEMMIHGRSRAGLSKKLETHSLTNASGMSCFWVSDSVV